MNKTKRLFLAIKIYPGLNLLKTVNRLKANLKHENIRWANQNNLHLTLKFFGETSVDKIDPIISEIMAVVKDQNAFKLRVEDLKIFGSSYNPKVIWAGFEKKRRANPVSE